MEKHVGSKIGSRLRKRIRRKQKTDVAKAESKKGLKRN